MSVYVDALRDWGWRLGYSCHMIADSNEELHEFAARLGLKREWFQKKASGPHYDLTMSKRKLAIQLGAIELEDHDFGEILKKWRENNISLVKAAKTLEEKTQLLEWIFR